MLRDISSYISDRNLSGTGWRMDYRRGECEEQ